MGESDVPVGARHEQNEQHAKANGRVVRKESEETPDRQRDEQKVAGQHRAHEPAIAEGIGQMGQRNLREGRVEQQPEQRPQDGLKGLGNARRRATERQTREDRGEVNPDLMAFQLLTCHSRKFSDVRRTAYINIAKMVVADTAA